MHLFCKEYILKHSQYFILAKAILTCISIIIKTEILLSFKSLYEYGMKTILT